MYQTFLIFLSGDGQEGHVTFGYHEEFYSIYGVCLKDVEFFVLGGRYVQRCSGVSPGFVLKNYFWKAGHQIGYQGSNSG